MTSVLLAVALLGSPRPIAWPPCPPADGEIALERPLAALGRRLVAGNRTVRLRLVNYQSAEPNWAQFWTEWDPVRVAADLDAAAGLGVNALRVFVFYDEFGGALPRGEMLDRLRSLLEMARERGMVVVVTFFPFKKDFRPEVWPEMEAHLRAVVARFRGDPAVAAWDLMNEPDEAWAPPGAAFTAAQARAWASHMARSVREADPTHLITIGLAGHFARKPGPVAGDELLPEVDVLSLHWFADPTGLPAGLARAKAALFAPLLLEELGVRTADASDQQAADAWRTMCAAADEAGVVGVGAWELLDHPVGSIRWIAEPESAENHFGLLRVDRSPKPQAEAFCRCLAVPRLRVGPPTAERAR